MEYNWLSLFSQSNLLALWKGVQQAIQGLIQMKQPWISIALLLLVLFGTHFLANLFITPFGIGLAIGAMGVMYILANTSNSGKDNKETYIRAS